MLTGKISSKELKSGGFDIVRDATHPLDFDGTVLFEQIIKDTLISLSPEKRYSLTTAYDYTLYTSEENALRVLQKNSFLDFDSKGKPILKLGIIYNISHLKKTESQLCKISYSGNNHLFFSHSRNMVSIVQEPAPNNLDFEIANKLAYGHSPAHIQSKFGISAQGYEMALARLEHLLSPINRELVVSLAQLYNLSGTPNGEMVDLNQLLNSIAFAQ